MLLVLLSIKWSAKLNFASRKIGMGPSFPDLQSLITMGTTMYICWFDMCRLSWKVQDSYCSVQNVQDNWRQGAPLYKSRLSWTFLYTAEESYTERYGNMPKQQIYFSGLTGLICEIWMFITFNSLLKFALKMKYDAPISM